VRGVCEKLEERRADERARGMVDEGPTMEVIEEVIARIKTEEGAERGQRAR
jgi:hypothetical protein